MKTMSQATIDHEQIVRITGYRQPSKQLDALHRLGFWRARRCPVTGRVILERPHYEAVCTGGDRKPSQDQPRLRPVLRPA